MIQLVNVSKQLNCRTVLDEMSLSIDKGQTKVVIGRSGCGKSVMLKHIVGILKPDHGEVLVSGKNITGLNSKELDKIRMKIALVFQGSALFDSLTVAENVAFGLLEHGSFSPAELLERAEEALCLVGLSGIGGMMPSDLSGGMKKRVALARAICLKPEIILYDEPTTGLDPITADSINELIKEMHDKLNVTSIVVTHDMKSAYKVADSIAMLYRGKIIAEGTPADIQNTNHPVVYQFINGLAHGPITETIDTSK